MAQPIWGKHLQDFYGFGHHTLGQMRDSRQTDFWGDMLHPLLIRQPQDGIGAATSATAPVIGATPLSLA